MVADIVEEKTPAPRLCHVVRWSDFDGYGFNLHSDKTKNGQFIGKVDDNSPAEAAGLKKGDRIIEVNGINIANENHKQVVERIKTIPGETRLLVVDQEADAWYRENKIVIRSSLKEVIYLQNPSTSSGGSVSTNAQSTTTTPSTDSRSSTDKERRESLDQPSKSGADSTRQSPTALPEPPTLPTSIPPPVPSTVSDNSDPSLPHSLAQLRSAVEAVDIPIGFGNHQPEQPKSDSPTPTPRNSVVQLPQPVHIPIGFGNHAPPAVQNDAMHESHHETVVKVDVHDATNATASQLTAYRPLAGEDEKLPELPRRSSLKPAQHSSGDREETHAEKMIRFSPSTNNLDKDGEQDGEVLVERVEHGPAFDVRQDKNEPRERLYESVERRQNGTNGTNGHASPSLDQVNRDRSTESSDSSSAASVRSYTLEHTDSKSSDSDPKDLGFEDASTKTPSPSPAVVPYQPARRTTPPTVAPRVVPSPAPSVSQSAVAVPSATPTSGPRSAANFDGLALGMSAQEMREMLQRKKRPDPRTQRVDIMKKHELVNNM